MATNVNFIKKIRRLNMRKVYPKCNTHIDCFANKDGYCIALKLEGFSEEGCVFFKTKQDAEIARDKSFRRLVEIGREDLIEKYGGRKTHEHQKI
jgi:hypothetical protein